MTSQAYEERSKGIWKTLCANEETLDTRKPQPLLEGV